MRTFHFLSGIQLGRMLFGLSDNLSKTLQQTKMSAAQAQDIVSMTVKTPQKMRDDASFELFWKKTTAATRGL